MEGAKVGKMNWGRNKKFELPDDECGLPHSRSKIL
jgi:hypothetical protein